MNKIEHRSTDNPKLKEKKMTDGQSSLYLDTISVMKSLLIPKRAKNL